MKYIKIYNESNKDIFPGIKSIDCTTFDYNISYPNIESFSLLEISKIKKVFSPITNNLSIYNNDPKNNSSFPFYIDIQKRYKCKYIRIIKNGRVILRIYKTKDDYYNVEIYNNDILDIPLYQSLHGCYTCDQFSSLLIILKKTLIFLQNRLSINNINYIKNVKYTVNNKNKINMIKNHILKNEDNKEEIDEIKKIIKI